MLDDIHQDAEERMGKSLESLSAAFAKIRTGRANPRILDGITVEYYGVETPLNQLASINVEDARTLAISPWEKKLLPQIEKAILKSDVGITPSTSNDVVRLPLPPLTEQNRKDLVKQARHEAEQARVAVRNIRRDAMSDIRDAVKEKMAPEDEGRRAEEKLQALTDRYIGEVDKELGNKESDLLAI
ncbi:MAG: ribosome recycling factor [Pseudomonadales bacterium]|nr:ribosome recycling factor [Pseudomonadales bacterium]MCP5182830.1 ribosome recycling factor [Pseudomonadales bacterium]